MRSESIKSILRSYLKERQHSSVYDDVDGLPVAMCGYLAGESIDSLAGRATVFADLDMEPQLANIPFDELDYVPLQPEMEAIAVGIGRQLSEMSDEFESHHIDAVGVQGFANGTRSVHFREHIMRVSPNSDHITIPVIRTGSSDNAVNVEWRTCDKSAKAGLHYVSSHGNIIFAEGDEEKSIEVEIIKSPGRKTDMCFAVELFDAEGTFNTFMVYIVDESKLYPEERQTFENIFNCRQISVSEIATRLGDSVTNKTFKAALLCLCSTTNSIPKELALASELLRLTIPHARLGMLKNVFCDFFSDLPELEEVATMF